MNLYFSLLILQMSLTLEYQINGRAKNNQGGMEMVLKNNNWAFKQSERTLEKFKIVVFFVKRICIYICSSIMLAIFSELIKGEVGMKVGALENLLNINNRGRDYYSVLESTFVNKVSVEKNVKVYQF